MCVDGLCAHDKPILRSRAPLLIKIKHDVALAPEAARAAHFRQREVEVAAADALRVARAQHRGRNHLDAQHRVRAAGRRVLRGGADRARGEVRWMCAFDTSADDIDAFLRTVHHELGR